MRLSHCYTVTRLTAGGLRVYPACETIGIDTVPYRAEVDRGGGTHAARDECMQRLGTQLRAHTGVQYRRRTVTLGSSSYT